MTDQVFIQIHLQQGLNQAGRMHLNGKATNFNLSFVVVITSSNDLFPETKSSNEYLGFIPKRI